MVAVSSVLALLLIVLAVVGGASARMPNPSKLAWGTVIFATFKPAALSFPSRDLQLVEAVMPTIKSNYSFCSA